MRKQKQKETTVTYPRATKEQVAVQDLKGMPALVVAALWTPSRQSSDTALTWAPIREDPEPRTNPSIHRWGYCRDGPSAIREADSLASSSQRDRCLSIPLPLAKLLKIVVWTYSAWRRSGRRQGSGCNCGWLWVSKWCACTIPSKSSSCVTKSKGNSNPFLSTRPKVQCADKW